MSVIRKADVTDRDVTPIVEVDLIHGCVSLEFRFTDERDPTVGATVKLAIPEIEAANLGQSILDAASELRDRRGLAGGRE